MMNPTKFDRRVALCSFGVALLGITTLYVMELIKEVRR